MTLPYSVIRGEKFKLQILVFNYKQEALTVAVTLKVNEGFVVRNTTGDYSRTVEVNPDDAVSLEPWIVPVVLGEIRLLVEARSATNANDAVERKLLVEPECIPELYSEAELVTLKENSITLDFSASFPNSYVEGSEYITVTVSGDIMGPSISGLENLIRQPYGCGEQNMISFVPNIYALNYLNAVDQETPKLRADALRYMESGYQRQLQYKREDNSFSAFGNSDNAGSTWLTAFVVKSFKQASVYVYIDNNVLRDSLTWLLRQRDSSKGTWSEPPEGRVIHSDMQGGTGQGIGLTAYVLMTFLENKDLETSAWGSAIEQGLTYLEEQIQGSTLDEDPLAVALITYTLHLAQRPTRQDAFEKLMGMKTEKDGFVYWVKTSEVEEEEDMADVMPFLRRHTKSTSSSIEMTSYALLTMALRYNEKMETDLSIGLPTMKYLASQRNERGGFHSTQDTVMALYALSEYARLVSSPEQNVEVSVIAGSQTHTFQSITKEKAVLLQRLEISAENRNNIRLTCSGQGTALVQLNVRYHVCDSPQVPGVSVEVNSTADETTNTVTTDVCAKYEKEDASGMVVIEMVQLSSYQVIDPPMLLEKYANQGLKRVETPTNKLVMYLDQLTSKQLCFEVKSEPTNVVADVKAAPVSVYSYYKPQVRAVRLYLPVLVDVPGCEDCIKPEPDLGSRAFASLTTIVIALLVAALMLI